MWLWSFGTTSRLRTRGSRMRRHLPSSLTRPLATSDLVGFASDATAYSEPHPTRSDSLCPARWITFPVYKATTRGGCCDASGPLPNRTAGFIYYRYVRPARPQVGRPGERSPHRARPEGTRLTGGWFPNIRGLRLVRRALHPARTPAASGLLRALEPSKDQSAVGRFEGGAVVVVRGLV